jgi:hypothetical protein
MRQVQKRMCAGRGAVVYCQEDPDDDQMQEFIDNLSSDWKELLQQALNDNQPVDAKVGGTHSVTGSCRLVLRLISLACCLCTAHRWPLTPSQLFTSTPCSTC